jgi:dUTP pyrophosphatase
MQVLAQAQHRNSHLNLYIPTINQINSRMYILYICPETPEARDLYMTMADMYNARAYTDRDAGFDLFSAPHTFEAGSENKTVRLSQNASAAFYDTERGMFRAYWLLPRSSISKTCMRLANSVGLIDAGYRGTLLAAVDCTSNNSSPFSPFSVGFGDRYFQVATPDLLPWDRVEVVDVIPGGETSRGAGGFGSTGLVATASAVDAAATDASLSYFS